METTTQNSSPKIRANDGNFNASAAARSYGLLLGGLTAVYLIMLNFLSGEVGTGARFAKHLLIIPVIWIAVSAYANKLPEGRAFKRELEYLMWIAVWSAGTIALINIAFFALAGQSFEQFMQEGETLAGVMINSGFLMFETLVFVMIIGFVILQGFKGKGSPED